MRRRRLPGLAALIIFAPVALSIAYALVSHSLPGSVATWTQAIGGAVMLGLLGSLVLVTAVACIAGLAYLALAMWSWLKAGGGRRP